MCLNVRGRHRWANGVVSIIDTGGCESLISARFVARLGLKVYIDQHSGQNEATSVTGGSVSFVQYVNLRCDFNGVKKMIWFYVTKSLPQDLLFGNPCLVDELGAVLDLVDGLVTFKYLNVTMALMALHRQH